MVIVDDATTQIIEEFGEVVTVTPQEGAIPEDSSDPIYFENPEETGESYEEKVRVYSSPSEEVLKEYGFEQDVELMIYNDNGDIEEGDVVEYNDGKYVVISQETKQLGSGQYRWVYELDREQ